MSRRSKHWLLTLGLVVGLLITVWLVLQGKKASSFNIKPTLSVAAISVNGLDENNIDVTTKLQLDNPLPFDLNTRGFNYEVFINNSRVLKSAYNKALQVKSNGRSTVEMPMQILTRQLIVALDQLRDEDADSADYTIQGTYALELPIAGRKSFTVKFTKRLPAFKSLSVRTDDVDIKKMRLSESVLRLELLVSNPNIFPVKMKDADYDVLLGKDLALSGTINGITNIPAKSTVKVPVQLEIRNKQMVKMLGKVIAGKVDTPFAIDYQCKMVSKDAMFNNSRIAVRTKGTLADLKDLAVAARQVKD